jgi:lipopolysaccharide assembly protein A
MAASAALLAVRRFTSWRPTMRWINIAVITIFAVVLLIFATQNFQTVSVYFLTFKMSAPHAVLIIVIYLIGMVTGGGPGTLMRQAFDGARSS